MKILARALALLAILTLSSCGLHQFKQGDPLIALEQSKESSKVACYQAQERNKVDTAGLSEMGKVIILQQQSYERLVGALTGKSFDPCGGGTNLNDVLIADSQQRNESLRSVTGSAAGVVKFGLGVWGATEVVDSIGKNAGTNSTVNTEGGDSSISNSRVNTETNTNTDVSNTGEEGTATTSGGFTDTPIVDEPLVDEAVDDGLIITED